MVLMNTDHGTEGTEETGTLRPPYGLMLGLQRPWRVETVNLDGVGQRLELGLEWDREGGVAELSGMRAGLPPARSCAREAMAASGCDGLRDHASGESATDQMPGSWGQQHGDSVGTAARSVHPGF